MLKYEGYTGHVEFDDEADLFHGEVLDLKDVITFQGKTPDEIRQAFRDSIDDYLEFCKERGEDPDRPFSGRLILRLPKDLHRNAFLRAKKAGMSLNNWITSRLNESV
ncbi:MAG: type II toxin-antitoxin system HicB family antitoxin [Rhodothermia bacterium]|nr:MAG: type II toxin-antitoxin system HicB family antitoxin [Rhodothermia bacterium]